MHLFAFLRVLDETPEHNPQEKKDQSVLILHFDFSPDWTNEIYSTVRC